MPAKVVVIGLDAAESTLVEPWARDGTLPGFGRLTEEGTLLRPATNVDTLPASVWPEISTGRLGGRVAGTGTARCTPVRRRPARLEPTTSI